MSIPRAAFLEFDFGDASPVLRPPPPAAPPSSPVEPRVESVSQLTRRIRTLLEGSFSSVWVEGEVSNLRRQSSGHNYFTLKDEGAQLSCVLFKNTARALRVDLNDGDHIRAFGSLSIYEPRGQYQLVVQDLQLGGVGTLQARFDALKRKLSAEGLFDQARKKDLPQFPLTIAIVTSPSGAALRDMLHVFQRRAPWLRILICPARVQGAGAHLELADWLHTLNFPPAGCPPADVIVLARGGGSIEDLWEFNEEALAREVARSRIPVVSAIGHEIDFTIADFVADLRSPTPSAAAELLSPDGPVLHRRLDSLSTSLEIALTRVLDHRSTVLDLVSQGPLVSEPQRFVGQLIQQTDSLENDLAHSFSTSLGAKAALLAASASRFHSLRPDHVLEACQQQLAHLDSRLTLNVDHRLQTLAATLQQQSALLRSLGPPAVFARGYSMTTSVSGRPVHKVEDVVPGEILLTRVSDGEIQSTVR